ncbi:MAG TPA: hypothetical protein VM869_19160 [Enhygromyxa sp.]|nr:hypothetical protein [Enhygromyxa sp.]
MQLQEGARISIEFSRVGLKYVVEQVARVGRTGVKAMAAPIKCDSEEAMLVAAEKIIQTRLAELGLRKTAPGAKR